MTQFKIPNDIRWVGTERADSGFPIETTYFKTVFELTDVPKNADLKISANDRYILYVNGQELIHGPCRGDHWYQYCDTVSIAESLVPGKNVIAVKVTAYVPFEATNEDRSNFGPIWSMSNSAGPLLIVWGEFGGIDVSTGRADWFCKNDIAIDWKLQFVAFWMGCAEIVDGKAIPHGWEKEVAIASDFSPVKQKWTNQVKFGEIPSNFLYERPIKHLLREKGLALKGEWPSELAANGSYEFLLDAKTLTTSFVYLPCKGGAGSSITLVYSEAFVKKEGERRYRKDVRSDTSGELIGITDIYYPGGGDECYSPSWFRTFRFIKVTVVTGDEPLILQPIELIETRYPLEDKVSFKADNQPWINNVWDISRRTLELCMHESYEDCPYYEQLQYTMDTRLQMMFNYILNGDSSMQLKAIHDYHTSMLPEGILQSRFPSKFPQVIPIFSLHWIFMLKDYYMETGDISVLERYRPTMEAVLAWFKRKTGAQGLVENLGYWDFADWTDAWSDISGASRASLTGPSTINNMVYAYALNVSASILDDLNLNALGDIYRKERVSILEKLEKLCWSEDKGLYREGPAFEEYSQHAQMWAVLNGIATGEKAKNIMTAVLSDTSLVPCSFVMQYYMFRALEEAGMYKETENLWSMWKGLIDLDLSTVPEIPGQYTRSDCHAWGALILHELPRKFLGIKPSSPGYERIEINPKALYLGGISGDIPTPKGNVKVSWSINDGKFVIEGTTPVPSDVVLPDGSVHDVEGDFSLNCAIK